LKRQKRKDSELRKEIELKSAPGGEIPIEPTDERSAKLNTRMKARESKMAHPSGVEPETF
jgi:hypothetical protein